MQRNQSFILILLASLLMTSLTAKAGLRQLNKVFELTLHNNPTLQMAQADVSMANNTVASSEAQQKPSVSFQSELSYAWMSKNQFPRTANQLLATYPLYKPDLNNLTEASEHQKQAKVWQLEVSKQLVLKQVAQRYFNYVQLLAKQRYLQKEADSIREIMQQLNQRFQVGYQDLNDVVEVQARLDTNQVERLEVLQALHQEQFALNAIVGKSDWGLPQDLNSERLPKPLPVKPTQTTGNSPQNYQAWYFLSENHPVLQVLKQTEQALQNQILYQKQKDGVQVSAFGALVYNDSEQNFYDDMQGARGGVQVTVPLYLGGRTSANTGKIRSELQKIVAQKQQQRLQLNAQAQNAWVGVSSGLQRLKALRAALDSNKQALQATEQGLKTGSRNIIDLLNAQRSVHKAERDIPLVVASIWQNWYEFYWAIGNLSEEINLSQKEN